MKKNFEDKNAFKILEMEENDSNSEGIDEEI